MASTYTNTDLTYLSDKALAALITPLDEIKLFAHKLSAEQHRKGDAVKVYVHGQTEDAAAFNRSTNNYGTVDDDTTTGVDVSLSTHLKKTCFVPDEEFGRIDEVTKVEGIAKAVAKAALIEVHNQVTAGNFATIALTSTPAAFTYDDVIDLQVVADDAGFDMNRALVIGNTYNANLMKDGHLVTVRNSQGSFNTVRNQFAELGGFDVVSSSVIKSSTPWGAGAGGLGGFITDGSGLAIATGLVIPASGQGTTEYTSSTDAESGFSLGLRRYYDDAQGGFMYTAEVLFGTAVARAAGLQRITQA